MSPKPTLTNASTPTGGGFRFSENLGLLGVFTPGEAPVEIETSLGLSDAWPFDVLVVEPGPDSEFEAGDTSNGVTFNALPKIQLERAAKAGQALVGVISLGEAQKGKSAPYVIAEATPAQLKAAQAAWAKASVPF